jgi:hypothetical protein
MLGASGMQAISRPGEIPGDPSACASEDRMLAKGTFLRYVLLGLILLWRVWRIRRGAMMAVTKGGASEPLLACKEHPYEEHPTLTQKISSSSFFCSIMMAGWLFVLSEGIGMAIYFAISAAMDNFAIFFVKTSSVCKTVKAVSLYTMAVVTFLPNVLLGSRLQKKMYNEGSIASKALFFVIMAFTTVAFFVVRMWLVYSLGYVSIVNSFLDGLSSVLRVALAVAVPPVVDGIQSMALIMIGSQAKPRQREEKLSNMQQKGQLQEQLDEFEKRQTEQLQRFQDQLNNLETELSEQKKWTTDQLSQKRDIAGWLC